jgi:hypothetical protein
MARDATSTRGVGEGRSVPDWATLRAGNRRDIERPQLGDKLSTNLSDVQKPWPVQLGLFVRFIRRSCLGMLIGLAAGLAWRVVVVPRPNSNTLTAMNASVAVSQSIYTLATSDYVEMCHLNRSAVSRLKHFHHARLACVALRRCCRGGE